MDIDKYEKRIRNSVTDRTVKSRVSALRSLEKYTEGEPTVEDVEEYLDAMIEAYEDGEMKASVIREYFKSIKSYFGVVKGEPEALDHINWLPSTDSDPGDYMDKDEWERFKDSIRTFRNRAYFITTYQYARRPKETLLLNKEDLDMEGEQKTITFSILKKSQSSNTPTETIYLGGWDEEYDVYRATYELKGEALKVIKTWLEYHSGDSEVMRIGGEEKEVHPLFYTSHGRMSYNSVYKATKDVADRARIEDKNITPKTLRHSRSTHLDWEGEAPGNIAREMLIHDPDTAVIGRYIHDRGEDEVRDVMGVE